MQEMAEKLASSLLFEGYALYPYTSGATKNATPTPFGIVYPPAYAARLPATYDHLQIECVALASGEVELEAEVLFLQAAGTRHKAAERRVTVKATLQALSEGPVEEAFAFEPASALEVATGAELEASHEVLTGTLRVAAEPLGDGMARVTARVENTTSLPESVATEMDRAAALRRSLLSTHTMLGLSGGRFVSPLENEGEAGAAAQGCENINSWPVLATADDDAVLGAAILLPDHPQISAQSQNNMFDNTEIEEALTLHVQTLSDSERAEIAEQDPTVREMIERVDQTTPEQLLEMHGEMKASEPDLGLPQDPGEPDFPEWSEPTDDASDRPAGDDPAELPRNAPPEGFDPEAIPGEAEVIVDGKAFQRGGKVVLRPGTDGDPYDKMLHGQEATIRRIFLDYDGRAYLGVTVDADPMAEILGDSGRFLFFFADEVEAV